jgi:hypothetical protein
LNSRVPDGEDFGHVFSGMEESMEGFFTPQARRGRPQKLVEPAPASRPEHYKVISISLYVEDIERLKTLVASLKKLGHSRANQSMIIREALRQFDPEQVPSQR